MGVKVSYDIIAPILINDIACCIFTSRIMEGIIPVCCTKYRPAARQDTRYIRHGHFFHIILDKPMEAVANAIDLIAMGHGRLHDGTDDGIEARAVTASRKDCQGSSFFCHKEPLLFYRPEGVVSRADTDGFGPVKFIIAKEPILHISRPSNDHCKGAPQFIEDALGIDIEDRDKKGLNSIQHDHIAMMAKKFIFQDFRRVDASFTGKKLQEIFRNKQTGINIIPPLCFGCFTQDIMKILLITFTINSAGLFLPTIGAFFWKKSCSAGAFASMLSATVIAVVWFIGGKVSALPLFSVDALWPSFGVSAILYVVICLTHHQTPAEQETAEKFYAAK